MTIHHVLVFYGRTFANATTRPVRVHCSVGWHVPPDADDGWSHLLDALREFAEGDVRGAIVPANIAAESSLMAAMFAILNSRVPPKRVEGALQESGYGHVLRTFLPFACGALNLPTLRPEIVDRLANLKDYRNKIAHTGKFAGDPPERRRALELLAAAVFGFRYGRYLRGEILARALPTVPDGRQEQAQKSKPKKQRVTRGAPSGTSGAPAG